MSSSSSPFKAAPRIRCLIHDDLLYMKQRSSSMGVVRFFVFFAVLHGENTANLLQSVLRGVSEVSVRLIWYGQQSGEDSGVSSSPRRRLPMLPRLSKGSLYMERRDLQSLLAKLLFLRKSQASYTAKNKDMDFSLDGDFGKKISSFNVDMSDLDFSSPPKKLSKPKEKSTEDCPTGKQGGKQSHFAFDFNFNELDSFDFGSSLPEGKLKSNKAADLTEFDSPGKQEKVQTDRNKPIASIDLPEETFDLDSTKPVKQNNLQTVKNNPVASMIYLTIETDSVPTSEYQDTIKSEYLVGGTGKVNCTYGSPSTSANFGILSPAPSTAASPEKKTSMEVKEDQCSQQSETIGSSELKAENVHRDLSVPSLSMEGSIQEAGSDAHGEVSSMVKEEINNSEKALDISVQLTNREYSPRIPSAEPKSTENGSDVMSGNQSDVDMEDISINEMNKANTERFIFC